MDSNINIAISFPGKKYVNLFLPEKHMGKH